MSPHVFYKMKAQKYCVFSINMARGHFSMAYACFAKCREYHAVVDFLFVFGIRFVLFFASQNHIHVCFITVLATFSLPFTTVLTTSSKVYSFFYFAHTTRAFTLSSRKRFNAMRTALSPQFLLTWWTAKTLRCSIGSIVTEIRPCLPNCFSVTKAIASAQLSPPTTRFVLSPRQDQLT